MSHPQLFERVRNQLNTLASAGSLNDEQQRLIAEIHETIQQMTR
jgi:hypothetical protein